MEEAKSEVRTKIALIEQHLKLLHECQFSGADYKDIVSTIHTDLASLKDSLTQMQTLAKSRLAMSLSAQYHETYDSLKRELSTLLRLLEESTWKKQLLGSGDSTVDESFSDILLREDRSIDSSLNFSSSILEVAQDVRNSLANQKKTLTRVGSNVVKFAETLPGINVLLRKISRRHRFNAVVVSVAVGVCLCLTLYLTFS
mmetsp:Transcript_29386/g.52604  ORF Transcript_29386/g.52604 Transcript_29386/m.52604 type:complete len:200 (+) Transcript_29386:985-1584(+)